MALADLSVRRGCSADLASFWRGLRLFSDPRGRSTRTELVMLFVLPAALLPSLQMVFVAITHSAWDEPSGFAVKLLIALPLQCAVVRRLHDMGKSGWLAIPMVILTSIAIWDAWLNVVASYPANDLWYNRGNLRLFYGIACVGYFIALMFPPRNDDNPYGPDPRPAEKDI